MSMCLSPIEFQLYDWLEDHENNDKNDNDEKQKQPGKYIIHSFGRTEEGQSVYCKITDFTPYFYILLPNCIQNKSKEELEYILKLLCRDIKNKENKKVYYLYKNTLQDIQLVKFKKAEGFNNNKKYYYGRLVFNSYEGFKKYKYYLENNSIIANYIANEPIKFTLYEANIPPMFRCFHIRNISGCSWINISNYKLITENKKSICDIEIYTSWENIVPIKKDKNAPLIICSFDIETYSIDGQFPQAKRKGDCIIQIGATYTKLGESKPYRQYISCLNDTLSIDDTIIVESHETEEKLIKGFINEIKENDCDIITGYNIFFFDEKYIYDRCKDILKIDISNFSKLKDYKCPFNEFKRESSAMGENILRYWSTPGRVHIDLMKDVQRTYSLSSYKLDNVASKFIRGKIKNWNIDNNHIILHCDTINDIFKDDYIHIEITKGFVSDEIGYKYLVKDINYESNQLVINYDNKLENQLESIKDKKYKIEWSQAKDDVSAKDIFRLFKGSSSDRSIVAKYCIKDCRLVNLLVNKLETVMKNIEMSNVCYVPLSFLFTRGQGIKLFSLCLKEYRKQKYIFPVIKMKKNYKCKICNRIENTLYCQICNVKCEELESEHIKYEGAIVFDPIPSVEYEAVATKDYASLYPSSIIHKNMSHETLVINEKYNNLENVEYYDAYFKENNGNMQYRRFAKVNNTLGVIPMVLDTLLKERKSLKHQMKNEADQFKYKILDAKQYALKITANSLYGQLGAPTSPLCSTDIAACTTSTGREMLLFARKYDEEILPWIINTLKYYNKKNMDYLDYLCKQELHKKYSDIENNYKLFIDTISNSINNLLIQPIVRYGDSVIGTTPLLLRNTITQYIYIEEISKITNNNYYYDKSSNKEYAKLDNIETWTEKGWTNINTIMRHRLDYNKKLYRITTYSGSVVVTEDHSLIDEKGINIFPKDINDTTKLLHSFPNSNDTTLINNDNRSSIITSNDIIAMKWYYSMKMKGYNIDVNCENNIYKLTISEKINTNIRSIELYTKKVNYVYDLTTLNNHFHAGVGSLIVHNTDSIFSCYKFRENAEVVNEDTLYIWKKIVNFGKDLIFPYLTTDYQFIFNNIFNNYYGQDKILRLELPKMNDIDDNKELQYRSIRNSNCNISLEDKIKYFIKEYMEESYIPWLWCLVELIEKNKTDYFDMKIYKWAEYQLSKMKIICQNLTENRKKYLIDPILSELNSIFIDGIYINPSMDIIEEFTNKLINNYSFSNEINIEYKKLLNINKNLFEKTLRDKWIYSCEKKDLKKLTDQYIINSFIKYENIDNIRNTILQCLTKINTSLVSKLKNILITELKKIQNSTINDEYIKDNTQIFIDKFNKIRGKKALNCIIEEYIEKDLGLNFDKDKLSHYNYISNFINTYMREQDMTDMNKEQYMYYYLQPRWEYDENYTKYLMIDIYKGGNILIDKRSLEYTMEMGKFSGELIKSRLPFPHICEYEKTFWPFAILTKKKYVGNKYEFDTKNYKQDFMGIVLKRRDNSPIVKEICSGIIHRLINMRNPQMSKDYTITCLQDMFNGKYDIKYFLQSRTLKSKESYKNWSRIAHVYLADKIYKRDPGNTPQSGDRIEFAVIKINKDNNNKKLLQGDIIETPQYIKDNNLEIDYLFYLTNQIMNPALQFLELVDKDAKELFNQFIQLKEPIKVKKEKNIVKHSYDKNKLLSLIEDMQEFIKSYIRRI
jgi:DNA polymerase elongation subunit (family B)